MEPLYAPIVLVRSRRSNSVNDWMDVLPDLLTMTTSEPMEVNTFAETDVGDT